MNPQNNPESILVVEDEPELAQLLADYLQAANFAVHTLHDGIEADTWLRANKPDLVLLDLMLPGKDGLEICKALRQFSNVPVIMVTAKVEEIDRLLGLELGADDYICKPFSPREVVARVKAVLRRFKESSSENATRNRHGIALNDDNHCVSANGQSLELTTIEFRLFQLMFAQPGKIFSRQHLMDNIYTDYRIVSDRTVDSHIKKLRKKLQGLLGDDDIIRSVYGAGYKFETPLLDSLPQTNKEG